MSEILLRPADAADLDSLAAIYRDAVTTLGPTAYSPDQVEVWRRWPADEPAEFRRRVLGGHCWLAAVDGEPAAFATYTTPDHLDFLYTRGNFARRGLATRLHHQLESIARDESAVVLRTEASLISRPVFQRLGYEVNATETVNRGGQAYQRFRMRKFLEFSPDQASSCRQPHTASFAHAPSATAGTSVAFVAADPNYPGWFKGVAADGTEGFFPAAWFQIDPSTRNALAQRDYDARELTVQLGVALHPIEVESGWVRVHAAGGGIGWIPATCLSTSG